MRVDDNGEDDISWSAPGEDNLVEELPPDELEVEDNLVDDPSPWEPKADDLDLEDFFFFFCLVGICSWGSWEEHKYWLQTGDMTIFLSNE